MRQIGGLRGQHQFGIGCQVNPARTPPDIGQGHAPRLGIIFGGHHNFGQAGQGWALMSKGGVVFAKHRPVVRWVRPGGLHSGRPCLPGIRIAHKNERPQRILGRISPPTGNRQIAPAAIACPGGGQHDAIAAV